MIARVARFRFPSLRHRDEAERNGSGRVGPSLARQPGFVAIYFGRIAEFEAFSISMFDDRDTADAAAITMNDQPLLTGQVPEMLPTPEAVTFYEVVASRVHDQLPSVGRLGYLRLAQGQDDDSADRWARAFADMLGTVSGLCQAYFLRSPDSDERVSLTFWTTPETLSRSGAAIGSWQAREGAEGRAPAYVGDEGIVLTDLRMAIASVPATMPVPA